MTKIIATVLSNSCEDIVGDAVSSVVDYVDEVLLIDTGIGDSTRDVVRQIAGDKLVTLEHTWVNDFADARNFALDNATRRGAKWALTVDTDERIAFGEYTYASLRDALAARDVYAWLVYAKDGSYAKERFIRIPAAAQWSGRVHEALSIPTGGVRDTLAGVHFVEQPKSAAAMRQKWERDRQVLQDDIRKDPKNSRALYYLGQTYESLHLPVEAASAYAQCVGIRQQWPEQAAWAAFRGATCYCNIGQYAHAADICAVGLSRQYASPELAWLLGFCRYRLDDYTAAAFWGEMAVSLGAAAGSDAGSYRIGFRHLPAWYELPYDLLHHAYIKLGNVAAAHDAKNMATIAKAQRELAVK